MNKSEWLFISILGLVCELHTWNKISNVLSPLTSQLMTQLKLPSSTFSLLSWRENKVFPIYIDRVWIQLILRLHFCVSLLLFFFYLPLFLTFQPVYCILFINSCTVHNKITRGMHTSGSHLLFTDPQTSLFSNFFIKNGFYGTIYTFKNYFATVFSIFSFSKISSIQTDPKTQT